MEDRTSLEDETSFFNLFLLIAHLAASLIFFYKEFETGELETVGSFVGTAIGCYFKAIIPLFFGFLCVYLPLQFINQHFAELSWLIVIPAIALVFYFFESPGGSGCANGHQGIEVETRLGYTKLICP